MAEEVEITGTILDMAVLRVGRARREGQKFFLVQDSATQQKYPLYIARGMFASGHKFWKVDLQVGDKITVKGKTQKLVSQRMSGVKIIKESDLEHKDAGVMAYAVVVVPKEMSKLEGPH